MKIEEMKISEFLSDRAEAIPQDIKLHATRDLSALDYELIRMFCMELEVYWKAAADINENGYTNEHDQVSPAVSVRNKAANNLRQLYKEILKFCEFESKGFQRRKNGRSKKNF